MRLEIRSGDKVEYAAEVLQREGGYSYTVGAITIEISKAEAENVVANPELRYFTTALRLHKRIMAEKTRLGISDSAIPAEDLESEDVLEHGELVAWQDWDSGGPGAGAGRVSVYQSGGAFYVLHDAGLDGPFPSKAEALEAGRVSVVNEATVAIWDRERGYLFHRKK